MCMMTIAMCQAAVGDTSTALETAKKAQSVLEATGSGSEAAELVEVLKKHSRGRGGPTFTELPGWGASADKKTWDGYQEPKFTVTRDDPNAAGVKRSMYSDIVKTRIMTG